MSPPKAAAIKHLVSDTAAFIISGSVIIGAIWYLADIPKQVEAHGVRLGRLEAMQEKLDEINQRLARIEGRLELWQKRRQNH